MACGARTRVSLLVAACALLLFFLPATRAATQEEGPYGPQNMCDVSADSEDFGIISTTPLLPSAEGGPPSQPSVYSLCPAEAYYLTYVDSRGVFGTLAEAVQTSGTGVLESAQKTGTNAIASSIFVWHAKLVAVTINVMMFAFDFDAVSTFGGPVERVVKLLGEGVYYRLVPVVYVLAVGYAAWISIGRNEVANGLTALLKSAVVGAIGVMVISNPLGTTQLYQDTVNNLTGQVFRMVDKIGGTPIDENGNPLPSAGSGSSCPPQGCTPENDLGSVSVRIWETYVENPWMHMQMSSASNDEALAWGHDVLRVKYSDDRAKMLCDLAGKSCGGLLGDGNGGDQPEETTSGETTGGETTSEGGSTR